MQRRTLLATVGTVLGSAGCLSTDGQPTPSGDDTVTTSPRPTDEPDSTHPGDRPDATDVFDDVPCPSFDERVDRTVCYHTTADEAVVLTAEPEVFDPYGGDDVETLSFVLYNHSEWTLGTNPYDWSLHRFEGGGEWTKVGPDGPIKEPLRLVAPGQAHRWALPAEVGSTGYPDATTLDVSLSPGIYAFSIAGTYQSVDDSTDAPTIRTEFVALARIETAVPVTGPEQTTAQG